MYHVSAQGFDERMINVHYYYYKPKEEAYISGFANHKSISVFGVAGH